MISFILKIVVNISVEKNTRTLLKMRKYTNITGLVQYMVNNTVLTEFTSE